MRTFAGYATIPALLCALLACGGSGPNPDAVIFVDGGNVTFQGTLTAQEEGEWVSFDVAVPGNVVIFRTDGMFGTDGQTGEAGQAYRIRDDGTLDPIGSVDLTKSDDELARQYGVEPGSAVQLPR